MPDPMLAEALNPRLAAQRRMETEGQATPVLRDPRAQPPSRFGKRFTPEQRLLQQMMLSKFLRERAAASAPTP